jgi:hypothetical protein
MVLSLLYGVSILAVFIMMLPWYYKFIFVLFLIVLFIININNKVLLKNKRSIRSIEINHDGSWILHNGYGEQWRGILQGDSFCSNFIIILNFRVLQKNATTFIHQIKERFLVWPVVLFYDAMTPQLFRQLRVQLWMHRKNANKT